MRAKSTYRQVVTTVQIFIYRSRRGCLSSLLVETISFCITLVSSISFFGFT